jgi:hypothetical protein
LFWRGKIIAHTQATRRTSSCAAKGMAVLASQ